MVSGTVKKIQAFKKLMKIVKKGSFELYTTSKDNYHQISRSWPVDWYKDLGNGCFKTEQDKQRALDDTLACLVTVDFPSSVEQLKKEKRLARLILDAGADPNKFSSLYSGRIYDIFLMKRKAHIALEIAQTEGFIGPENPEQNFNHLLNGLKFYLHWKKPFPGQGLESKEQIAVYAQDCEDQKELVYTLFQKGMYPRDKKVFEKLVPIVLEKDPEFFEKRKATFDTYIRFNYIPLSKAK